MTNKIVKSKLNAFGLTVYWAAFLLWLGLRGPAHVHYYFAYGFDLFRFCADTIFGILFPVLLIIATRAFFADKRAWLIHLPLYAVPVLVLLTAAIFATHEVYAGGVTSSATVADTSSANTIPKADNNSPPATAVRASFSDEQYLSVVDKIAQDPAKANWKNLRRLYIESSFARENGALFNLKFRLQAAAKKMAELKTPDSISEFKDLLRKHFGNIGSHLVVADLASKDPFVAGQINGNSETSAIAGLLAVIVATGDGKSEATAFRTICCEEDGAIVEQYLKGQIPGRAALWNENGNPHLTSPVNIKIGNQQADVYFTEDEEFKANEAGDVAALKDKKQQVKKEHDAAYLDLVGKAQANPEQTDWRALRELYAETDFYSPFATDASLTEAIKKAAEKAKTEQTADALNAFNLLVNQGYAHYRVHFSLLELCRNGGFNFIDCDRSKKAVRGLIDSIRNSGDGRSEQTAFKVINTSEEYIMMKFMHQTPGMQALVNGKGHMFDWWQVQDAAGAKGGVYFNIDIPYEHEGDELEH